MAEGWRCLLLSPSTFSFWEETPLPDWKEGMVPSQWELLQICTYTFSFSGTCLILSLKSFSFLNSITRYLRLFAFDYLWVPNHSTVLNVQKKNLHISLFEILSKCYPDIPLLWPWSYPHKTGKSNSSLLLYSSWHRSSSWEMAISKDRLTEMGQILLCHPLLNHCFILADSFAGIPLLFPLGLSGLSNLFAIWVRSFPFFEGKKSFLVNLKD